MEVAVGRDFERENMSKTMEQWDHPQDVDGLELDFGGDMKKLLPPWSDIPEEFKSNHEKWNKVVWEWFYRGLAGAVFAPKPGINEGKAIRHIGAIMKSWQPKHEHKTAGCAFLLSRFFSDVKLAEKKP